MATRNVIIDVWSALSHKENIGDTSQPQGLAPSWVTAEHRRRLNAYLLLWAYRRNVARFWLNDATSEKRRAAHREYGDAELMVQTIRAAVLGEDVSIQVDGADGETTQRPTADDVATSEPELDDDGNPVGDPQPVEGAPTLDELIADWEAEQAETAHAVERQEWFDQWADDEKFPLKLVENEDNSCGLGDACYVFAWSNRKKRVRCRLYEPGFYFPVWDDDSDDEEFPDRVHLAWETIDDRDVKWLRRITFDLVTIEEAEAMGLEIEGAIDDADFGRARLYPYQDEPSDLVCLMSDGKWKLDGIGDKRVADLDENAAVWRFNEDGEQMHQLDLGLDFLPVLHVPNTPTLSEHWGESVILRVAQILDDLAANDTDTAIAAALSASPPITISGGAGSGAVKSYGPGQVFWTGDGNMDMLDTSKALDALLKFTHELLDRLHINRQLPASVVGRMDQDSIKSGLHLLLTYGPFRTYIGDLRLVRDDKYRLGFKMVQRIAMVGGDEAITDVLETRLAFGSFMPSDLDHLRETLVALVKAHLLSRATALRWLQEAGAPIESIDDELDAIQSEDFEGAGQLADATNLDDLSIEYLHLRAEAERARATAKANMPEPPPVGPPGQPPVPLPPGPQPPPVPPPPAQ